MRTCLLALATTLVFISGCSYLGIRSGGGSGGGSAGGDTGGTTGGGGGGASNGSATGSTPTYSGAVDVSVTYRERIILPQDAVVVAQLVDSAGKVLAENQHKTMGVAPPYAFHFTYTPSAIKESERYHVRADILLRGSKRFTTTSPVLVITQGAPSKVEIVLQAMRQ